MQDLDELIKTSISSFYKENNFKPCLTKQLLNMFKLWCEGGIKFYSDGIKSSLHSIESMIS